jgi:hypothetical protein
MRVSEGFVEHVAHSDRKLIVTLTSGMGSIADNTSRGSIVYRSSKAAVNMVMRSLAIIEFSCRWYSATATSGCFLMVARRGRSATTMFGFHGNQNGRWLCAARVDQDQN